MKPLSTGSVFVLGMVLWGVMSTPAPAQPEPSSADQPFVEAAAEVGLDFKYRNGMDGSMHLVEITGGGAALFDYDGDGDLDVYLTQGHTLTPGKAHDPEDRDRLFRNELVARDGQGGDLRFIDVTEQAGLDSRGYGLGVATGDYDNDGDVDLYVTNFGPNQLWRNEGDGTFVDVTDRSGDGVGDAGYSVAATFVDLDGDGWLDLYVGNYGDASIEHPKTCRAVTGEVDYCGPLAYRPTPDRLLHNVPASGGGRAFVDVTSSAGMGEVGTAATGLGVSSGDFDGDGRVDLFVANDGMANHLWLNRTEPVDESRPGGAPGSIRMVDDALFAGVAFNVEGAPEASMGVATGDVDGDGLEDLLVTHLLRETHTLYLNRGGGAFLDATGQSGIATPSFMMTGFGTAFLDYDLDGDLDLMVVNGAVTNFDRKSLTDEAVKDWILAEGADRPGFRLHQPNQLFRNDSTRGGKGRKVTFIDVTGDASDVFRVAEVSRGLAVGDVDNDGDPDAVVVNCDGPVRLLMNRAGDGRSWLGVRAVGVAVPETEPRDLVGARVGLKLVDGTYRWRTVRTDGSYASAGDPRVIFGLAGFEDGDAVSKQGAQTATVRVAWPDGTVEDFPAVATGRYSTLLQGQGQDQRQGRSEGEAEGEGEAQSQSQPGSGKEN